MGYKRVLWIASLLVGAVTAQTAQTATVTNPGDVAYHRRYMYVGGGYVVNSAGQHVFSNQMYVERLTPTRGASKTNPIVFVHGQAQTGTVCNVVVFPNFNFSSQ